MRIKKFISGYIIYVLKCVTVPSKMFMLFEAGSEGKARRQDFSSTQISGTFRQGIYILYKY